MAISAILRIVFLRDFLLGGMKLLTNSVEVNRREVMYVQYQTW